MKRWLPARYVVQLTDGREPSPSAAEAIARAADLRSQGVSAQAVVERFAFGSWRVSSLEPDYGDVALRGAR